MTGLEAWHIVSPLIAHHMHPENNYGRDGKYQLNVLDEAYITVFGALKEHDERRKQEDKT